MAMHPQQQFSLAARSAGVLLHLTSLPGRHGCGDMGVTAREFAVRLAAAGQRYWQVLPLNPTTASAGESPYFSDSAQAGNPLLISLEDLVADGLLPAAEVPAALAHAGEAADFERARAIKLPLLYAAARSHAHAGADGEFEAFCREQAHWLDDHALFAVLKQRYGGSWIDWPVGLRRRDGAALAAASAELAEPLACEQRVQYFFHRQWQRLHGHCRELGLQLFGDMPIYVNYDSADVWANTQVFQLDEALRPVAESGVPPDYFSATGQLWRNPVYDWRYLEGTGFAWWVGRLGTQLTRFDLLRIDHFRGLVQYWEVPAGADTAVGGQWKDVPGYALFNTLRERFQPLAVVAEDLGTITPDVIELRDHFALPGMIVLQFAFHDDHHDNPYKPENHVENAVAYIGTHDNTTARGWLENELDDAARWRLAQHLPEGDVEERVRGLIDLLLASRARTAIVCAQDLLGLPEVARMNTPGLETGNWRWQLTPDQLEALPLDWLGERCEAHGR